MIRHVALFTFKKSATSEQVDAMARSLLAIESAGMIRMTCGRDLGVRGTADFAIVGEFESIDAYKAFSASDDYQAYREHHSSKLVDQVLIVQYRVEGGQ